MEYLCILIIHHWWPVLTEHNKGFGYENVNLQIPYLSQMAGLPWLWAEYAMGNLTCITQYMNRESDHQIHSVSVNCLNFMVWLQLQMTRCKTHQSSSYFCSCKTSDIWLLSLFIVLNWNGEIYCRTAGFFVQYLYEKIIQIMQKKVLL